MLSNLNLFVPMDYLELHFIKFCKFSISHKHLLLFILAYYFQNFKSIIAFAKYQWRKFATFSEKETFKKYGSMITIKKLTQLKSWILVFHYKINICTIKVIQYLRKAILHQKLWPDMMKLLWKNIRNLFKVSLSCYKYSLFQCHYMQ